MTRPSATEVFRYRAYVDEAMFRLLDSPLDEEIAATIDLGLHHEQQHQELILTDILHVLAQNPLKPAYQQRPSMHSALPPPLRWVDFSDGIRWIGHAGDGFAFDNEGPRHRVFLEPYQIAGRLTTNAEFTMFIDDGGYNKPEYWLSDGWAACRTQGWHAPMYWERTIEGWSSMSLSGFQKLDMSAPVTHVSYYEADAYARWAGARLPTEFEWESALVDQHVAGNFVESAQLEPRPATRAESQGLMQMYGDVWEWTGSAYLAYPGYQPAGGALGEYNGKFGVKNYADLAKKTVASTTGTTNAQVIRKYNADKKLDMQLILGKDHDDSLLLVESDRAVAFAMDDILLFGLMANSKNPASLEVVGDSLQVEPYACMVRKDDPEFKKLVDGTINRMMKSGEFAKLYTKWFESAIVPKGVNLGLPMSAELKVNLKALSDKPAL